ncbi:glycosyltransferase family 2 protein [Xylella fastidiosa]|uniref:Glycosyltransferase family 2 protein n=1 Tax=Xylella fastidiosa TaxID=2371 RepID=A0ABC8AEC0_XYLFS|nr:glycosyltransferase family 2 protein [Xylella fastidiosa]ALR04232.1 glycosyltransferase family 2 protein [Xylella fastidiosa]ALR06667.1 glycosyltransferase family 2 protein [Xylella fastidiosa]ALR06754.1 glycosyltransferase family 2 protein [Xylella fastidiosa]KXB18113.1 dolichyl-phosphate mannose synthase [Xylella fastidiosa]OJZ70593.1 dolichyl-phosphate mannose synthase [Xylella fastidiosa 6c]
MNKIVLTTDTTAIIIPALNEALSIRKVITDALAYCPHVIVVDDGSDDGTANCISDLPIILIRHPQRRGKGAALRSGFAAATQLGVQGVITMDGDGQHSAADFPRLLAAANYHPGCVIIGARLRKRSEQPWIRRIGNHFGDWGISWGCGCRIVDTQSGQRFYPVSVFTLPDVSGEDFVFEAQLLISAARQAGARMIAVPIEARYSTPHSPNVFRKSHFRMVRDLWKITSHVAIQIWRYGHVIHEYWRTQAHPVVIDNPDERMQADHGLHIRNAES